MMIATGVMGAGNAVAAGSGPITGPGGACASSCAGDRLQVQPAGLDPSVAPGGNFNLSVWELQLPIGSPGSPTTIPPSQLKGASGYTNPAYFWTDKNHGSMTFWDPESGVTTPNSNYARSELREINSSGSAADWSLSGTHKLSATLRIVSVTSSVCVGQIHLGSGGSSTKPLLELYYHSNGNVVLGLEKSPDGGQTPYTWPTFRSAPSGATSSRSSAARSRSPSTATRPVTRSPPASTPTTSTSRPATTTSPRPAAPAGARRSSSTR
jgi:hypothetical protein